MRSAVIYQNISKSRVPERIRESIFCGVWGVGVSARQLLPYARRCWSMRIKMRLALSHSSGHQDSPQKMRSLWNHLRSSSYDIRSTSESEMMYIVSPLVTQTEQSSSSAGSPAPAAAGGGRAPCAAFSAAAT